MDESIDELKKKIIEIENSNLSDTEKDKIIKIYKEQISHIKMVDRVDGYRNFSNRIQEPWIQNDFYKNKILVNNIPISELKNKLIESQIVAIIKRPFWFEEIEKEVKEDVSWGEIKTITHNSNDRNNVVKFGIIPDFSNPNIKVLVKYIHYRYNSGGDGVPAMYNNHSCIYYFTINENGRVSEDKENRNNEKIEENYVPIDFNS